MPVNESKFQSDVSHLVLRMRVKRLLKHIDGPTPLRTHAIADVWDALNNKADQEFKMEAIINAAVGIMQADDIESRDKAHSALWNALDDAGIPH